MFRAPSARWFAALAVAVVCLPGPALLASPPRIAQVRVGLPTGRGNAGRSRNGAWAPVAVTLEAGRDGNTRNEYRLRIETRDLEELSYLYTVDVPALTEGSTTVQGYIVPG